LLYLYNIPQRRRALHTCDGRPATYPLVSVFQLDHQGPHIYSPIFLYVSLCSDQMTCYCIRSGANLASRLFQCPHLRWWPPSLFIPLVIIMITPWLSASPDNSSSY